MNDTHYNVVYRGKLLEGFEFETAKQNLLKISSISEDKAKQILKNGRVVLKKNADESTAKKFGLALKMAGLDVALTKQPVERDEEGPEEQSIKAPQQVKPIESKAATLVPAVSATTPSRIPFEFKGTGSEYFKIWLVNIVLSIITLGIYSPWAKVRRKQYFYGSIRVQEASFEYLADPVKILKGRAIVGSLFIIHSLVSNALPIAGSVLSLAFIVIFPWLVVRSLAFNARNSSLRNIRFGFDGTVRKAAKEYVLWPIAAVLTLGILSPYVYFRQKKFVVENSTYGTTKFQFAATAGEYYRLFFSIVITAVIGFAVVMASGFFFPPAAVLLGIAFYLYVFALFSVKSINLLFNSSRLANHRLEADLDIKEYVGLVVTNSLATALTLGLFHPWATIRTLRYKLKHLTLLPSGNLDDFIAKEQEQVSAMGEEMSDFFDFDVGL